MRMRNLITFRKVLKNPKSSKKIVDEIEREIAVNDRQYKERDKELKDLLKIIKSSQEIIGVESKSESESEE